MNQYIFLPDEIVLHRKQIEALESEHKNAGRAIGEAAGVNCDWHDNFAFDDAQRTFELKGKTLQNLRNILSQGTVLVSPSSVLTVSVGKSVILLIDGVEKNYTIGGFQTPIPGRVSYAAPLIRALLGKEEGEEVLVSLDNKKISVEIVSIESAKDILW